MAEDGTLISFSAVLKSLPPVQSSPVQLYTVLMLRFILDKQFLYSHIICSANCLRSGTNTVKALLRATAVTLFYC